MRILDSDGNQLTTYDREKGHLVLETIVNHIEAVPGVKEEGHYHVLETYENGGVTAEYIVDVAGREAVPEHDEEEQIYRYTLYTEKELAEIEISTLRQYLSTTDYCVIKCMETGVSPSSLYPEIMAKRAEARKRINELEAD